MHKQCKSLHNNILRVNQMLFGQVLNLHKETKNKETEWQLQSDTEKERNQTLPIKMNKIDSNRTRT